MTTPQSPSLALLFLSFLKLGATSFGGPAMIAYIRKMAVEQKNWLNDDAFRAGVALCQIIPGASAMQMAAYVGLRAGGVSGAAAAFIGFGLPAFLMMMLLSARIYADARFGNRIFVIRRASGHNRRHNCQCSIVLWQELLETPAGLCSRRLCSHHVLLWRKPDFSDPGGSFLRAYNLQGSILPASSDGFHGNGSNE